jgi:Fe-Mn family superoxide dismutase
MKAGGSKPSANFKEIINKSFASREGFKEQFITKATTLFGSGWVRLELSNDKLEITHYINQENPLMYGKKPVLGLDVREHAYYLHYQNRRPDYINAWWEIIDRAEVENRLA